MCSNWLVVLPHAVYFGDVLDHDLKKRAPKLCRNISIVYQVSNKKEEGGPILFKRMAYETDSKAEQLMRLRTHL